MTPERERQIREHWKHYRDMAREPLMGCGLFRAPVRKPLPKVIPWSDMSLTASEPIEIFEFKMEHGYMDDRPMTRVVCEGVEVEVGPRLSRSP